ncbi:MAG TPA: S16 family serine protease, partial [Gemmataceae bacterium]|nr:S16 family serine protease [Gemmataceae bacterium]
MAKVGVASVVVLMVAGAVIGCGGGAGNSVEVHALWYGSTPAGAIVGGVTPVGIRAVGDDPNTPLSIDLHGLTEGGAGPMWRAATAVAGVQAVLMSGADPRLQQLKYSLHEEIDGPSAGGLLAAGSLAALKGSRPSGSTTMTGTVLPDGSIGPVAGIGEKLRAAAAAGFHRVLIPAGVPTVTDYRTGRTVDPVRFGRSLGLEVMRVASVHDAYVAMTGQATAPPATGRPQPIAPGLLRMLGRRSRTLIAAAGRYPSADVLGLAHAAERALAGHDQVLAFTAAAEADLVGRQAAVSARVRATSARATLAQQVARVDRLAQRS